MLAECIRQLLKASATVTIDRTGCLELVERGVMKVKIVGVPMDAVVVNLSRLGQLRGIKDGPWKKSSDYVIVFAKEDRNIAIFVELKRTIRIDTKGYEQLRRSPPRLTYLHAMCEIHTLNEEVFRNAEIRYVIIGERERPKIDKQMVRRTGRTWSEQHCGITVHFLLGNDVRFEALCG